MTVDVFSIPDFVDYLHKIGIHPDLIMIMKYGDVYILDKQAIALYHTGAITFDCDASASQSREAIEKANKGVYIAYQNGVVVMPCKLTVDTCPVYPHIRLRPHSSSPQRSTPSGLSPHVRGRHSSVPTGLGLRPQPSQPSAQARGQDTNQAGV